MNNIKRIKKLIKDSDDIGNEIIAELQESGYYGDECDCSKNTESLDEIFMDNKKYYAQTRCIECGGLMQSILIKGFKDFDIKEKELG